MPIEIVHLKKSFIILKYHILNAITSILCKFLKSSNSKIKLFKVTLWSHMTYTFWVCQWVFRTLSCNFWMKIYLKTWCISMIFLSQETHKLHWANVCFHVTFVDLFISLGQYLLLFVSFGEFQHESYVNMWGHYESKVMGVYSRPLTWHQA